MTYVGLIPESQLKSISYLVFPDEWLVFWIVTCGLRLVILSSVVYLAG